MSRGIYDSVNKVRIPTCGREDYNIDNALSSSSQNAVENRVITNALEKAYRSDDTAETNLADDDYIPFYDTSASSKKKVSVSDLKNEIGGGSVDTSKFYNTDDTSETTLSDADTIPFYDASASAKRKTTWSNLIAKIKSAFGISSSGSTFLKKDGTWGTPENTKYSAGTGLGLNGTEFYTTIPRVAKSANSLPGKNKVIFEEYSPGSNYNLPRSDWFFHVITMEGDDPNYATQIAIGMSSDGAYCRKYAAGSWGSWMGIVNTWRGIQNNLTSSSTTDSLSANQGRILNNKFGDYDTSTEVNSKITNATSDVIRLVSFSKSYTVSWNTDVSNLISVPSGYTAIAPIRWDTGTSQVAVMAVKQNALGLEKTYNAGTSITGTVSGYVLCVKTSYVY